MHKKKPAGPPRVWIELEKPADKAEAERNCEMANNMLQRISEGMGKPNETRFFWSERENRYCLGGQMGYQVLTDNGEWFDLEYFGRPLA